MLKVAIVGANGFIGGRTVEMLHLNQLAEVRPVVRSFTGLARLARFDLGFCIANAFDQAALQKAFAGCDVVIHAIAGDRHAILDTLTPTYQAAQAAGVRRLVYLSTGSEVKATVAADGHRGREHAHAEGLGLIGGGNTGTRFRIDGGNRHRVENITQPGRSEQLFHEVEIEAECGKFSFTRGHIALVKKLANKLEKHRMSVR